MINPQLAAKIAIWGATKPLIKRIHVFGSRIRGDHKPESDIDIAIELDPAECRPGESWYTIWTFKTKGWMDELQDLMPYEVDLDGYNGENTPTIRKGLQEASVIVYEKAT